MAESEDIRIVWKTKCKWRDTDYVVKRKDVRPKDSKEGDPVKVKYDSRWYNAEIVEVGDDEVVRAVDDPEDDARTDDYDQFLAEQNKRERGWVVERELARKAKLRKKEKQDDGVSVESTSAAPCNSWSREPTDIGQFEANCKNCEILKKRVEELDGISTLTANLTKVIEEMGSSVKSHLSRIDQRLETLEESARSTEHVTECSATKKIIDIIH